MSTIIREFKAKDSTGRTRIFIEYNCDFCKKEHSKLKFLIGEHNFCSQACSAKAKQKNVEVTCAFCHKQFLKRFSSLRNSKSNLYFCSKTCKCNAQKINGGIPEIQPDHYGKRSRYRDIAFENMKKKCACCGYDKCLDILEVHHKNMNRNDNSLSNLEILCPTCHEEKHFKTKTGKWAEKKQRKK